MTDRIIAEIRAALDETARVARAALSHPTQYNPATQEEDRTGTDDGVWSVGHFASDHSVVEGMGIHIYDEGGHTEEQAVHIALHDPERELRMVAAHRTILDLHAPGVTLTNVTDPDGATVTSCMSCGGWYTMKTGTAWPCDTLLALAAALQVEV